MMASELATALVTFVVALVFGCAVAVLVLMALLYLAVHTAFPDRDA